MAHAVGIYSPPNALFFVAMAFILVLLLHFSAAVSRLADQSKVLAQRQAILEEQLRDLQRQHAHGPTCTGRLRERGQVEAGMLSSGHA